MHSLRRVLVVAFIVFSSCGLSNGATLLAEWDFTKGAQGWVGNRQVAALNETSEGLVLQSTGGDPWLEGPRFDAPESGMLRVTVEMKTSLDAVAQVFYGETFSAEKMVTIPVLNDGKLHRYVATISESTGRGTRLRIDPCQQPGEVTIRTIRIESLTRPTEPRFAKPVAGAFKEDRALRLGGSGRLQLQCDPHLWNGIKVLVDGVSMAFGYDGEQIGYLSSGQTKYLHLKAGKLTAEKEEDGSLTVQSEIRDSDGAKWLVRRSYVLDAENDSISVRSTITVDQDRNALLLPWLTLLPGFESYGAEKHQGLFAGLEFLENEPSSSKADMIVPAHQRRIPDPIKITFPLMAIEHDGRFIALSWETSEFAAAGFDSPDRVFGSKSHAMWLSGPKVGDLRFENDLVAHSPLQLRAGEVVKVNATVYGGKDSSTLGAVRRYVEANGLPPLPEFEGGITAAARLLARGWLDSAAKVGGGYRHAVWTDRFKPQVSAGPALHQAALSRWVADGQLSSRLNGAVEDILERLNPADPFATDISHVKLPTAPLLFGRVPDFLQSKRRNAYAKLKRFDDQGRVLYRPGEKDFGKTHFARHANGLGGLVLAEVLEAAVFCADKRLTSEALRILNLQTELYRNSVPRGAQTWEVPLHTPDILASAHMVRAYTYGYVLSGQKAYLEQARYWAWTGVPFIYLVNPTEGECGPYSTIAVLGATSWVAPIWVGLPVQWCGAVYASSLHLLEQFDPEGPWDQLARGITLTGLQMTWPVTDKERMGLLPDFFHLQRQVSDGPAINPGTIGALLPDAFGVGTLYQFRPLRDGRIIHAPCEVEKLEEQGDGVTFGLAGWGERDYRVVIVGVDRTPKSAVGKQGEIGIQFHSEVGALILQLKGNETVTLKW